MSRGAHRVIAALVLAWSAAGTTLAGKLATRDGRDPRVTIVMPEGYRREDFPVGVKTFRLDTNLPPESIEGIVWTLDGARAGGREASVDLSFEAPGSHAVEACVTTRDANYCDRQRLGPPPETVRTRSRLITAWVVRKGGPAEPVTGLGREDFGLAYRGRALEGRILGVYENSARNKTSVCLAYLMDVSGSMMGDDVRSGKGRVLAKRQDGSHELAHEVRARFEALAEFMDGVHDPEIADLEEDLIMGGVFAGGLLTIGPVKASRSDTIPARIEKLMVTEYLRDEKGTSGLWAHTALHENVALVAMILGHEPACASRKKVVAVDSDLVQYPEKAAVDVNDRMLEMVRGSYDQRDGAWLIEELASDAAVSVPVYAIDRNPRPYTPYRGEEEAGVHS